jgi:hypothetical protein
MTICAGMKCPDGIVLCADTLEAVGSVHRSVQKLVELPLVSNGLSAVVVCATDDAVFSDALIEKISDELDLCDGTYHSAKNAIEEATVTYCSEIWKTLDPSQNKPTAQMLIGLKTVDDLRLLHLSTPVVRAIEGWEFLGYGLELGIYKASQYGLKKLPTDAAAPIIAYIVDVVKSNVQFCGRATNLAIIHSDGRVEHKSQQYIAETTQGYKRIGWLLDTWVFPFLPVMVGPAGEDVLSMIGKLGEPKNDWAEKIPGWLSMLSDRKKLVLAGEVLAVPENQKRKQAIGGISLAARIIANSFKTLSGEGFLSEESLGAINYKYEGVERLCKIIETGMDQSEIDAGTIREAIEKLCVVLTYEPPLDFIQFDESEGQPDGEGGGRDQKGKRRATA